MLNSSYYRLSKCVVLSVYKSVTTHSIESSWEFLSNVDGVSIKNFMDESDMECFFTDNQLNIVQLK